MTVGTKHFQDSVLSVLFALTEHANFLNITKTELQCPESLCSAPPAVPGTVSLRAQKYLAESFQWAGIFLRWKDFSLFLNSASNLWCLKQHCLQTCTSGEAGVLGPGTAGTRRGMVKQKMSSCTAAPDGLLQRQWCGHQAGSLTGLQLLLKHQCWISELS